MLSKGIIHYATRSTHGREPTIIIKKCRRKITEKAVKMIRELGFGNVHF